ncbi:MAG: hypothetical protein ACLPXM_20925 [Terriglobales bacterium]
MIFWRKKKEQIKEEEPVDVLADLPGADKLREWFGYVPDFHDGEVISLSLARTGASILRVYPYAPKKPAVVDFVFEEITDLSLEDFSPQNVISLLTAKRVATKSFGQVIRVRMGPCYGIAGTIDAKRVRIEVVPGKSPDGVSQW